MLVLCQAFDSWMFSRSILFEIKFCFRNHLAPCKTFRQTHPDRQGCFGHNPPGPDTTFHAHLGLFAKQEGILKPLSFPGVSRTFSLTPPPPLLSEGHWIFISQDNGATDIFACCTHGIFSDPACERINACDALKEARPALPEEERWRGGGRRK